MKKEEDKSYLIVYVIVSFLLVAVTAWAIVNETFDRRPWKNYQKQFYRLEYEKIKQNYNKERAGFESPEVQKKYGEAKNKLEHAREDFKKPLIQAEYGRLSEEQRILSSELETLKFKAIVMRNESMEKEYIYGKNPGEHAKHEIEGLDEKGKEFAAKIKDLEGKIASIKARLNDLKHDVDAYTEEFAAYTTGMERYKCPCHW